nr:patatin-like protein 2 isoform X1 [Tanacetum cinerariifolium]
MTAMLAVSDENKRPTYSAEDINEFYFYHAAKIFPQIRSTAMKPLRTRNHRNRAQNDSLMVKIQTVTTEFREKNAISHSYKFDMPLRNELGKVFIG